MTLTRADKMIREHAQCKKCGGTGMVHQISGRILKRRRENANVTVLALVGIVGCSRQHIYDIESGKRGVSPELAEKYLYAVGQLRNRRRDRSRRRG